MWPPPYHTKALAEHDWTLWLEASIKSTPNIVNEARRSTASGTVSLTGSWATVFTLPTIDNANEALFRYVIGDGLCEYRVRKNGDVIETVISPSRALQPALLDDLRPGDVIDVQARDPFGGFSANWYYLIEENRNPATFTDKNNLPAPKYENADPRWYGFWLEVYETLAKIDRLQTPSKDHESTVAASTTAITSGVTYDLVSHTTTAKGRLRIHCFSHSWHNQLKLYKDGNLVYTLEGNWANHSNLREGVYLDTGDGEAHTYVLKGTAIVTTSAYQAAEIHVLVS